ncbi:hypothetical protein P175DRAFT_0480213 [Aspergillus ochraceoroseus IBT 24754]|uniref:Pectinesterase n=2 Tax=Aspergillus ochraceoroseus TaxID=138278 RepID=A0A2T5LTY8_9EURO|nr:uncharacterized protein P175DRAFT_0480213 [Aspergillus ochraceoroseus IBT 24754]KKK22253.1 putative pectin methylesterase [Aspergillus ochraceoroseus]PTU19738.1 hypothetical protein P175DRAFT_0480213 [Aspergillus ochraceoroseus IBT 24754]
MHFLSFVCLASVAYAASRTTAPSGSIVVAKSGGHYDTISSAVSALSTTTTKTQIIYIEKGTYAEQVYIPALEGELIIYGETEDTSTYSSNLVTITSGIGYPATKNDDKTATLRNHAKNSKIYNINVKNTYGKGHQALALSAYGEYQGYYGCQFIGYQDTVLAEEGYQVYGKCLIEGAIDFIFGQYSPAWFDSCDIRVVSGPTQGTITANGRVSSSGTSYFVINKSTIEAASGNSVSNGAYYLGRPWSEYARVVFQETTMSSVIKSAGWIEWSSSTPNTEHVIFGEYGNSGDGSEGTRASFASKLRSAVSITTILGSDYKDWVDTDYLS